MEYLATDGITSGRIEGDKLWNSCPPFTPAVVVEYQPVIGTGGGFSGLIGFIGLVAPHIARILLGEDHRFYLPVSVLIDGLVLSLASKADREALLDGEDSM